MKVKKYIKQEIELDIEGVTLLSVEEALSLPKSLPKDILSCDCEWWLRSPGHTRRNAATVINDGFVSRYGTRVEDGYVNVRPAFIISNLESVNLKIGDKIQIKGIDVTIISDTMALADEPVGYTCFRIHWKSQDGNDYEKSDIKKWLEEWWNDRKEVDK